MDCLKFVKADNLHILVSIGRTLKTYTEANISSKTISGIHWMKCLCVKRWLQEDRRHKTNLGQWWDSFLLYFLFKCFQAQGSVRNERRASVTSVGVFQFLFVFKSVQDQRSDKSHVTVQVLLLCLKIYFELNASTARYEI